ncbi:MAG: hypothetical protein PVF22_02725 [Candidatus Aminicenantes bacterium]
MKKQINKPACVLSLIVLLVFPVLSETVKYRIKVILEHANIRLKPDIMSQIIETAPIGAVLEADKNTGDWFQIKLPPDTKGVVVTGYIHASVVEILTEEQDQNKSLKLLEPVTQATKVSKSPSISQRPVYPAFRDQSSEFGWAFQFSGGIEYVLSLGDIDSGFQSLYDFRQDDPGYDVTGGQYNPLHTGKEFGGEVILSFTPLFGLRLGAGYIHATRSSLWEIETGPLYEQYTAQPTVKAIPLTVGLQLNTPREKQVCLFIHGGVGYYLSTVEWRHIWYWEFDDDEFTNTEEVWQGKSNVLGYHGGLGLEFKLGRSISFVIEGLGRYVKLNDLTGDLIVTELIGDENPPKEKITVRENRTLWYAEDSFWATDKTYPRVLFRENKPSFKFYDNIRKAVVDLSGISALAGFKIRIK